VHDSKVKTMKKLAIIINIILIQSIIAINAASLHTTDTDTNNNKSKHTKQYYKRKSYQWNANLHRTTGIATSFERSIFHYKHQPPPICSVDNDDGLSMHRPPLSTTKKKQIKHIVQDIFSSYPNFLTKPSLTFGLCQSIPSNVENKYCNHHLQTSLLHLNMLTFGKPRIVKPSKKHIFINNKSSSTEKERVICCIEIPIKGGLLANVESKSSTTSKKKVKIMDAYDLYGYKQNSQTNNTPKSIKSIYIPRLY